MRPLLLFLALLACSCSTPSDTPTGPAPDGSRRLGDYESHPATYVSGTASPDGPRPFAYRTHVRPLINFRCTRCHNTALASRSGGLDLSSRDAALSTGRHAPVIVPGNAAGSYFVRKLTTRTPDGQTVPVPVGPHALSAQSIATLTRWIDEGADWTY